MCSVLNTSIEIFLSVASGAAPCSRERFAYTFQNFMFKFCCRHSSSAREPEFTPRASPLLLLSFFIPSTPRAGRGSPLSVLPLSFGRLGRPSTDGLTFDARASASPVPLHAWLWLRTATCTCGCRQACCSLESTVRKNSPYEPPNHGQVGR